MSSLSRVVLVVIAGIAVVALTRLYVWLSVGDKWTETKHPDSPEAFAYKTGWYAVRSDDPDAVAKALSIRHIRAENWEPGLKRAVDHNSRFVFVTPPIRGWVLVVGEVAMLDQGFEEKLLALSGKFGEAQYFASMRISSAYTWARARSGKLESEFECGDGSPILRKGNAREVEARLGLHFFDDTSPESKAPGYDGRTDLTFPDERDVVKVAGNWSVDPSKVEQYPDARLTGLSGIYPR